jgi:hypothetical protein
LVALRRCHIENLKGVSDLAPVAEAPNLEELLVISMRHLDFPDFAVFKEHERLRAATIGLGSIKRNESVSATLGLPPVPEAKPIKKYVEG